MGNPLAVASLPDLLDPRFRKIVDEVSEFQKAKDMIPRLFNQLTPTLTTERVSALTGMGLFTEFVGNLSYDAPDQGYDSYSTYREYAKAISIERALVEYEQFGLIDNLMRFLVDSAFNTRQVEAASTFQQLFIADPSYTRSEGVAVCSDSHTSPRSGVSTTVGFDNNTTLSLTPTNLKSLLIQFARFKQDNGQPIEGNEVDAMVGPPELRFRVQEILGTMEGLDVAEGTKNVLKGAFEYIEWKRLTDTNDYFLINKSHMKKCNMWFDKVKPEFKPLPGGDEFETLQRKYRGYYICHRLVSDWRWVLGAQVS